MTDADPGGCPSPLPLLLALPLGAIVGVPVVAGHDSAILASSLAAFGPVLRSDEDLRHAVRRIPARLVLDARALAVPQVEAALPALRTALAVVVMYAHDVGMLTQCCERILCLDAAGFRWRAATAVRTGRCLELRLEGASRDRDRWVRVPLGDAEGAEAVLSAVRANGVRVRESRIAYHSSSPR